MTVAAFTPMSAEDHREGRPQSAFFGWDSAAASPQHSPSPRGSDDEEGSQKAEAADGKRIQYLKLDLSQVSTAVPPSPAEPAEAGAPLPCAAAPRPAELTSPAFCASPRKRASSATGTARTAHNRFKLPLQKPKRSEKLQGATVESSPSEMVETPSTCAGTNASTSPRWSGTKQTYTDLAADLLEAGSSAVARAGRDPLFSEALACQGLVLGDLLPTSGLTIARRTNLLASVLQEKDLNLRSQNDLRGGARVLHSQLQHSVDDLASKMLSHREHRDSVTRRTQALADETAHQNQERAREEVERQQRVRTRDEAATAMRRARSRERIAQWQSTVTRGHDNLEAKVQEHRDSLRQSDQRLEQSLGRRDEARAMQCHKLQEHHNDVVQAGELSRQEAYNRMMQQEEHLQNMLKRSEEHLEALRQSQERRLEQRRQEVHEREHEVLRVHRAQEYARNRKALQHEEDSALFKECVLLREHLSSLARSKVSEVSRSSSCSGGGSR